MKTITYQDLKRTLTVQGHQFFEGNHYDLNLIGVRSRDRNSNQFNDLLCLAFKNNGQECLLTFDATTDPGLYYRLNPANIAGTAIVKPGQYRSLWTLGKHQGKYPALTQAMPITVYRDNSRDATLQTQVESTGYFGINLHRASAHGTSKHVGRWSAGCQVIANTTDFELLMALCRKSAERWGDRFTYTLLEEADLLFSHTNQEGSDQ